MMLSFRDIFISLLPIWASLTTVTSGQIPTASQPGVKTCIQIRSDIKQAFNEAYNGTLPDATLMQILPIWVQMSLPRRCQKNKSAFQNFNPSSSQDTGGPLGMMESTGAIYTTGGMTRKRREAGPSDATAGEESLVRNKRFIGGGFGGMGMPAAGGAAKKEVSEVAKMMNMLMMMTRFQKARYASELMNNRGAQGNSYYGDRLNFGGGMYGDQYSGKRKRRSTRAATAEQPVQSKTQLNGKSRVKRFFMPEPADAPLGMGLANFGMGMNPMMSMMVDPATGRNMKFGGDAMKDMIRNSFINTLPAHARPPPGKEPGDFVKNMAPIWYFSNLQQSVRPRSMFAYSDRYIPPRTSGFIQKRNRDGTFGDTFPRFGKRKKRSSDDDSDSKSSNNNDVLTFGDITVPLDFFKPPERDSPATPSAPVAPRPVFIPSYRPFIPPRRILPPILPRRPFVPPRTIPLVNRFVPRRPLPAVVPRRVPPVPAPRPAAALPPVPIVPRPLPPAAPLVRRPAAPLPRPRPPVSIVPRPLPPAAPLMRRPLPPAAPLVRSPAAPVPRSPIAPAAPLSRNPAFAPPPPNAAMPLANRLHGRKKRASEDNHNDVITVGDVSIPLDVFKSKEHRRFKRSDNNDKTESNNNKAPMSNVFLNALLFAPPTFLPPALRPSSLPGKPQVAFTPTGGAIYGDKIPMRAPLRRMLTPLPASPLRPLPPKAPFLPPERAPIFVPPPAAPLKMRPVLPPPAARPPVVPPPVARPPVLPPPAVRPPVVPPPAVRPPVIPPPAVRPPVVPPPAVRPPVVPPPAVRPPVVPPPAVRPPVVPPPAVRPPVLPPPAVRPPVVPPPAVRPPVLPPPAAPAVLHPVAPRPLLPLFAAQRPLPPLAPSPNPYSILAPRPPPTPLGSPAAAAPPLPVAPAGMIPPPAVPAAPRLPPPAARPPPPPASPMLYPNGLFYNPNNMIIPPPAPAAPRPPPNFAPPPPAAPINPSMLPAPVPQSAYAPIPVYQQPIPPAASRPQATADIFFG